MGTKKEAVVVFLAFLSGFFSCDETLPADSDFVLGCERRNHEAIERIVPDG